MATATTTTVTVKMDPTATSLQSDIIGPATSKSAGVMTAAQAAALAALIPMSGEIVKDNLNTWIDAANGSDTTGDGSEANPYQTFTKAVAEQPVAWFKDNIIWVKPGSYDMDEGTSIYDATFGGFVGDQGSPLAIIASDPEEFLAETTVTSATTYSVTVTGAGWTVNAYKGLTFWTLTGTGLSQRATVRSNTADTLYLQRELAVQPDATTTFKIIGPSNATELVGSNAAVVFPFIVGGIGMRDMQMRFTGGGSLSISDGTHFQAMTGCKIALGTRNMNIRRGAQIILGNQFSGQWDNSDQGIPLFPADWDCSTWFVGTGTNNNVNLDESSTLSGGMMCDGLKLNPGRNSSFRPSSLFATTTTITAVEGATVNFQGTTNVPTVLDTQKSASATTGIVNAASGARVDLGAATVIQNSAGHGLSLDKMSYADLTGGILSGAGNTGLGVNILRGSQVDCTVANLPTITGGTGAYQLGGNAVAANWAALNPATTLTDLAAGTPQLCRISST